MRRRVRAPIWYAPAYRLPIPGLEAQSGQEPRRADLVTWYLVEERVARDRDLRTPTRASYEDLLRVHDAAYLESLLSPETLARIFAVSPGEIVVDEVMHTLRLAVGGTIAAARAARDAGSATFNLMGGFHSRGPGARRAACARSTTSPSPSPPCARTAMKARSSCSISTRIRPTVSLRAQAR